MILELFFDTQKFSSLYLQQFIDSIVFNCNYFPYSIHSIPYSCWHSHHEYVFLSTYAFCILCVHYIMHTGLNICLNNECTIHFNAKYTPTFVVFMLSFIFTLTLFKI
uniref:Uncharacterized protein n=1 Tax=Cacopsylla melanoneura TaxID=428564 RepID=A0A8D8Z503_9HEMI